MTTEAFRTLNDTELEIVAGGERRYDVTLMDPHDRGLGNRKDSSADSSGGTSGGSTTDSVMLSQPDGF